MGGGGSELVISAELASLSGHAALVGWGGVKDRKLVEVRVEILTSILVIG